MTYPMDTAQYRDEGYIVAVKVTNPEDLVPPREPIPASVAEREPDVFDSATYIWPQPANAQFGQIVQILQQSPNRKQANVSMSASAPVSAESAGTPVTTPTPGQIIASVALPQGSYNVDWTVVLAGTLLAADRDNFALVLGSTTLAVSDNGINVGTFYPQSQVKNVAVPAGGATLSVQAIGAGTGSSVYAANLTATQPGTYNVRLCSTFNEAQDVARNGALSTAGAVVQAPCAPFTITARGPLWAVPEASNANVSIGVLSENRT